MPLEQVSLDDRPTGQSDGVNPVHINQVHCADQSHYHATAARALRYTSIGIA